MLEECGLEYNMPPELTGKTISSNRLPEDQLGQPDAAIVDHDAADGPLSIFESSVCHLRAGRHARANRLPALRRHAVVVLAGPVSGPMGVNSHFVRLAPSGVLQHGYSHTRYANSTTVCSP
jgi:hypothetical protein